MLGTTWRMIIWPCCIIPVIRRPGFIILAPSLRLLVLFSVNRSLAIAAVSWMLYLWSSRQTVCVATRSSSWILSFAVTFVAAVQWFLDVILFSVWRSLSLSFGFRPLFLLAEVFPWFLYAIITLETAALSATIEVAVLAKRAPSACRLWKSDKSPFFSTLIH